MVNIFKFIAMICVLSSCSSVIYQPDHYLYALPEQFKTKHEEITFPSLDGTKLAAWKLLPASGKAKNVVVYFHGNAQNLTSHFVNMVWLSAHDYEVIAFDYRGYGISEGTPEPKGVSEDGLAAINYAYDEFKKIGAQKFIVYTQSLGGAIAMKSLESFSHRDEISLLVLDSTFLSPRLVAREKTNRVLQYIITNSYTANPALEHLTMPILSIHSTKDPVIAYELGVDLFALIKNPKKDFWTLETPGHSNIFYTENFKFREKFLKYVQDLH